MRVLQLVSRDEPGGVQVLTRMIEAGFSARGIEVDTLALIRQGTTGERLSHIAHVARRIAAGRYDAIFSYHAAAGLVMATVGRAAGVGKRLSHLTAMPDAIHARWRALDKLAGATGGYSEVIANSAATAAALGVLTPMPCIPMTMSPWAPGSATVQLGKMPILNSTSKCNCTWGGVVSITFPGQVQTTVP